MKKPRIEIDWMAVADEHQKALQALEQVQHWADTHLVVDIPPAEMGRHLQNTVYHVTVACARELGDILRQAKPVDNKVSDT